MTTTTTTTVAAAAATTTTTCTTTTSMASAIPRTTRTATTRLAAAAEILVSLVLSYCIVLQRLIFVVIVKKSFSAGWYMLVISLVRLLGPKLRRDLKLQGNSYSSGSPERLL